MIVTMIEAFVKPDKREAFIEFITQHAKLCIEEPGCVRFDVLERANEPNTFFYYEVYKDEAARMAHRETPHFKKYAAESADMFTGSMNRHIVKNYVPADAAWR